MSQPSAKLIAALADRYVIDRELGEGGMATVHLARDVRHDRMVALKVLRPELAAVIGAQRFLAEIKTTANLQHSHILPLHDSGEADGTVFYVMPFVDGETLRDRIRREKQLPVDEAIRIAREVASALDYAHRHGVVHRDIKPENILLHDGQALVADFGISLAVSRADGGTRMTETGMSLGTPHYMAPEQAMGEREITAKADVYALGCVLYEMLTSEPPFTGTTAQAVIARAMTESPRPIALHRHTVPAHVEATVMRALEKLPADRFATAAEFAESLQRPGLTAGMTATRVGAAVRPAPHPWALRAAVGVATVSTTALIATLAVPEAEPEVHRIPLAFPASGAPSFENPIALSPDGAHLAYVGRDRIGQGQLWIKSRDKAEPTPLAGTDGVATFAFSPDSRWIAYTTSAGVVRRVPVIGGAALPVSNTVASARGLAWGDDESIYFVGANGRSLLRVPVAGGEIDTVWRVDSAVFPTTIWFPAPLPGSRGIVAILCVGGNLCPSGTRLFAVDLRSGEASDIAAGIALARYSPTGHLLMATVSGALLAQPFDPRRLRAEGSPTPVLDSIAIGARAPIFTVSDNGTLATLRGGSTAALASELVWVDRTGTEMAVDPTFRFRHVRFGENAGWALSPDGRRVAIGLNSGTGDNIWVKELPRGPAQRITLDTSPSFRPRWTRDGRGVLYLSTRDGNSKVFRRSADGTGAEELQFQVAADPGIFEAALAPDGRTLAFRAGGTVLTVGGRDILVARLGSDTLPRPLLTSTEFDEAVITLSPDGRWLAYESNEAGRVEVYLRPFPDVNGGKWQVSIEGGRAPLWSRDGRDLFYVSPAREMVAVPFSVVGTAPRFGDRKILFAMRADLYLTAQENYTPYDIAADGRFLMSRRVRDDGARERPLVLTENWFTELRRLLPR